MPESRNPLAQQKLEEAKQAFARKHYSLAHQLLGEAEQLGGAHKQTHNLRVAIRAHEQMQVKQARNSHWVGLLIGGFVYFILLFTPLNPRHPLWVVLALLVVPGVIGIAIGRRMGYDAGGGSRFWRAAKACGFVMFGYAFLSMIWQRTRFPLGGDAGQVFLVWVTASAVYALVAGGIAGLVAKFAWVGRERSAHGTAS